MASTHTAVEFAYRILTDNNNPKFKAILDNVIILLEPSENPDGVDIVTQWYRKTRGTPYDGTSPMISRTRDDLLRVRGWRLGL